MQERLYFMDNAKAAVICLMIVFHAAMAYMVYAPSWWYVVDKEQMLWTDVFVVWADTFIMPVMFFVSGYFGLASLSRHSQRKFWQKKFVRIGLPWGIGAVCLAPLIAYMMVFSRHLPISFGEFYHKLFLGEAYQHAHYWYLGVLLLFYLLLALGVKVLPKLKEQCCQAPKPYVFVAWMFLAAVGMGITNTFLPDGTWLHPLYLIVFQPTRLPIYLVTFFVGAYAWHSGWFQKKGYQPEGILWGSGFTVLSVSYILFVFVAPALLHFSVGKYIAVNALFHAGMAMLATMTIIAVMRRYYAGGTTAFWQKLAAASYPMYFVHQFFVLGMNYAVKGLAWPGICKYLLVCLLALPLTYLVSYYGLRRLPFFNGGK